MSLEKMMEDLDMSMDTDYISTDSPKHDEGLSDEAVEKMEKAEGKSTCSP